MENKTCGECKNFVACSWVTPNVIADNCEDFEPKIITNGDRIRQMSNEELASYISVYTICSNCPARTDECLHNASKVCKRKWLAWLNAPAECEGEDE